MLVSAGGIMSNKKNHDNINISDFTISMQRINGWHIHQSLEVFICNSEVELQIDKNSFALVKNDIIIMSPLTLHKLSLEETASFSGCVIHVPATVVNKFSPVLGQILASDKFRIIKTDYAQRVQIDLLLDNLRASVEGTNAIGKFISETNLANIFVYICQNVAQSGEKSDNNLSALLPDVLIKVVNYIKENCRRQINLDTISNDCFINKSYLCRLFKKHLGYSVMEFVNHCRIEVASEILLTGVNIKNCSEICGFTNPDTFTLCFKKIYDLSPRDYIKFMTNYQKV